MVDGARLEANVHKGRWASDDRTAVTLSSLAVLMAIVFLWGGLATGTSGQVVSAAQSAVAGLGGNASSTRSGNVAFSLFGAKTDPPSSALQKYRETTSVTAGQKNYGSYLPSAAVAKASTPYVAQQPRPLTTLGMVVSDAGIPVVPINTLTRNVIAYCEQLFLLIGLVRLLVLRWQRRQPVGEDLFWLAAGSVGMLGLITVLPSISADYGVLRAFQESLIFFSPVVVVGSATLFLPLGRWRAQIAASAVGLILMVNTTGLMPQILGGNQAELNLNNSGTYYDLYYMRPQDEAAVAWMGSRPSALDYPVQASYSQTKYLYSNVTAVNDAQAITDAFPTLVLRTSWVILGYPTVGTGDAYTYTRFNGDLIQYQYPVQLLNRYKDLVYSNGETVIYK